MNIRKGTAVLGAIVLLAGICPAQDPQKTMQLTLDECIVRALQRNISIQVAVLSPQNSELSVQKAREKFLPTMAFTYSRRNSENASYSWLESQGTTLSESGSLSAQVRETIPLGGTLTLSMNSNFTDTNQTGTTINPRYNNQLQLSFSQPLLRDFGVKWTQRDIVVARNNLDVSEIQFAKTVQDTIYNVVQAYWNLVYTIENLKVQQKSLALAKDSLAKNQRSVEIGTLAPMDVLAAESEVASREASILSAEAAVKAAEDLIKNILNFTPEEEAGLREITALDTPRFDERKIEVDQALAIAMDKRPDLRMSRINLKTEDLNLGYAKNQLLPNLSLSASYTSPGVSGTRLIYDSQYFGNVIDTIPGYRSDAWKDVFGFKYQNWNISLNLDVPLSNILSKASYAQAQISMKQALLNMKSTEQATVLEIRNAVRNLQTSFKQVQAYKLSRELAEKKLAAEEEKLRVGLSTNYTVLQYQRDLTTALVQELKSIIDYNVSQAGLERSMGTLLESKNIRLADLLNVGVSR
ncbi:MAG: TolC family protein [Candidatus Aminicenantes bacterium]|nr:TolC family protein [Candidatus Aminicenantes bacterium]